MKYFKIKKRNQRQHFFIRDVSLTSFPKPKIPFFYFSKINPPNLFKRIKDIFIFNGSKYLANSSPNLPFVSENFEKPVEI